MLMPLPVIAMFLSLACAAGVASKVPSNFQSVYTDLASAKCTTIKTDNETGSTTQKCAGIGGFHLLVHDDDSRQSVTVVEGSGKEHPLNFWHVVTLSFSSIGEKAEWRVTKASGRVTSRALILRVNAKENPDNPNRVTSYLVVTKITPEHICVTHKIPGGPKANESARRAADSSHNSPCLKEIGSAD